MALFRFYDTRILLALLGTLQATDATAFLSHLTVGIDNEQKIAFGRRVNGWWQFGN